MGVVRLWRLATLSQPSVGAAEQFTGGLLSDFLNNGARSVLLTDLPQFLRQLKTHLQRIFKGLIGVAWKRGCETFIMQGQVQIKIQVDMVAQRGG